MPTAIASSAWESSAVTNNSRNSYGMMPHHRNSYASNGYGSPSESPNMDLQGRPSSSQSGGSSPSGAAAYQLEHLATFSVSPDNGIGYPADGMRRLLQLEKSNGIWSQKMQMRLDRKWIVIMDFESGDVMERFPVELIREPTAFTSTDPAEMYNNILVFVVVSDQPDVKSGSSKRGAQQLPPEMHIFQCFDISAQDLVEELKLLMAGKMPSAQRLGRDSAASGGLRTSSRNMIPPPPNNPPPEPPRNYEGGEHSHHHTPGRISADDDASSSSSDKYERDVLVLNRCFDDIERFIARLQHAAAAYHELERRRKTRKNKRKDHGDGMLSMRAKPPSEREFIDILQKFKLSFNLLAKLKAHIHDPNAPELVHFLFTPLALIVDASRDSHPRANLATKIVPPLLTKDAVDLLANCLSSKETELWHSLGDAWLVPREAWKGGYLPPYQPIFLDGWVAPEYFQDERDQALAIGNAVAYEAKRTRAQEIRAAQQEAEVREHQYRYGEHSGDAYDNRNYMSRQEMSRAREQRYSRDDRERSHTSLSDRDVIRHGSPMPKSDISTDSIERGRRGEELSSSAGPGPITHFERMQRQWLEDLRAVGAKVVQVTYPRTANNDKELTVVRGEILEILDDTRKWWKARNYRGQVAHVPHTIVTPHQPTEQDGFFPFYPSQDSPRERESNGSNSRISPPLQSTSAEWVRKERQGKKVNQNDDSEDSDGLPRPDNRRRSHRISSSSEEPDRRHAKEPKERTKLPAPNAVLLPAPVPKPPPPPPPPTDDGMSYKSDAVTRGNSPTPTLKSTKSRTTLYRSGSQEEMVQQELREVLSIFREKKPMLDISKTPEVYITQSSTPSEVGKWLRAKGFSNIVIHQMEEVNGNMLFALTRQQLIESCGPEEGKRLYSQMTVQKNISGFKTARSSELKAILARARQKAEQSESSHSSSPDFEFVKDYELDLQEEHKIETKAEVHTEHVTDPKKDLFRELSEKQASRKSQQPRESNGHANYTNGSNGHSHATNDDSSEDEPEVERSSFAHLVKQKSLTLRSNKGKTIDFDDESD